MPEQFSGHLEYQEKKSDGSERRRATRVPHVSELSYEVVALPDERTLIETLDKLLTAQSSDVSETGLSMWTSKLLTPGTVIDMRFPPTTSQAPYKVKARVVWCQPFTEGGRVRARLGLEFLDLDPVVQTEIVKLVRGE